MVKISLRRSDADLRGTAAIPGGVEPPLGRERKGLALCYMGVAPSARREWRFSQCGGWSWW